MTDFEHIAYRLGRNSVTTVIKSDRIVHGVKASGSEPAGGDEEEPT